MVVLTEAPPKGKKPNLHKMCQSLLPSMGQGDNVIYLPVVNGALLGDQECPLMLASRKLNWERSQNNLGEKKSMLLSQCIASIPVSIGLCT